MICVTSASGTVGSEVIKRLEAENIPFRAAFFSQAKAEAAHARGVEVAIIDYNRPETLRAAFQGYDRLFLAAPNVSNQKQLELKAVEAAKAAGVRHIVKLSVLGADDAYSLARAGRGGNRGKRHGLDVSPSERIYAERRHVHGSINPGRGRVL